MKSVTNCSLSFANSEVSIFCLLNFVIFFVRKSVYCFWKEDDCLNTEVLIEPNALRFGMLAIQERSILLNTLKLEKSIDEIVASFLKSIFCKDTMT